MTVDRPTARQKRIFYVVCFCIALAIDLVTSLARGEPYRPSLVGLAIMITSVLWFAWSLLRDR